MILIADSGSSKTDWRLIDGDKISQFECVGLNPYIIDNSTIISNISALNVPFLKIREVYFMEQVVLRQNNQLLFIHFYKPYLNMLEYL